MAEALEMRTLLTIGIDVGVNTVEYLTPHDTPPALESFNGEGEGDDMVQVRARIAEDIPPNPVVGPANRNDLTTVNPGDIFRLEVYVQDKRTDDDTDPNNPVGDNFGVFASYMDVAYDDRAFRALRGDSNNRADKPQLPFSVSFQDPTVGPIPEGFVAGTYRYPNGPKGDLNTIGLVNDIGSFLEGRTPPGKAEVFHLDIAFEAQSIVAGVDVATVDEDSSTLIHAFANDQLISGTKEFVFGPPSTQSGAATSTEFLVFGDTGTGSIVPENRIAYVNASVDILLNGRSLQVQEFTQGVKGQVEHLGDGVFQYTPRVEGPDMDTFTYTLSDGKGSTDHATVRVTISAVNDAPLAVYDYYGVSPGQPLAVAAETEGVLANDFDAEATSLTATLVEGAKHGGLVFNADGSFTYTPDDGFRGIDYFSYRASDGELDSNTAIVQLVVASWQNPVHSTDVNDDGSVSAVDVLLTINMINSQATPAATSPFFDVSGDGMLTPIDVLMVINDVNSNGVRQLPDPSAPVVVVNTGISTGLGATAAVTDDDLQTVDADSAPAQLVYSVTSNPLRGQLEHVTAPGVPIGTFTQEDIDAGLLQYVHDGSQTASDRFEFMVSDGSEAARGMFFIAVPEVASDLARVSLNAVQDVEVSFDPATANTPRSPLAEVNAGDTFRVEVRVEDIRSDDDLDPNNEVGEDFGVHGAYLDLFYDAEAFSVPSGSSDLHPAVAATVGNMGYPISFRNGDFLLNDDFRDYIYSNGPQGDVSTLGVINDAGAFQMGTGPPGQDPQFLFDVVLKAESLVAGDDTASVSEGSSVAIDAFGNDRLVSGPQTITATGPGGHGDAMEGTELLLFGDTGFGTGGPYDDGAVVPEDMIEFRDESMTIINGGTLRIESFTQGEKGQVEHVGDGRFEYTPNVSGPDTDTFTYTLSDGQGNTKDATVTVAIHEPPIVRVRGRIAEDIAPDPVVGPAGRNDLTTVNPSDTFRLEVYLQDIRTVSSDFGVFASYVDVEYDATAFTVPGGTSNNRTDRPELPFPVSFQDPNAGPIPDHPEAIKTTYPYPNGLKGDLNTAGVVNDIGSFRQSHTPPGRAESFQFDIKFEVESIVATDDTATVNEGSSTQVDVFVNDELIRGEKEISLGPPSMHGDAPRGTDLLVFGGLEAGVPENRIEYVSEVLSIPLNGRSLQVQEFTQGGKGLVEHLGDGVFQYTPGVDGPDTDTFTYTLSDGKGNTKQASVAVAINAVEPPMARVTLNAVEDVVVNTTPFDSNTPRTAVADVAAGDTFRVEVRVQDIRDDDDTDPSNGVGDLFGIFAAYLDLFYDANSFSVPPGSSDLAPDVAASIGDMGFPISFRNGDFFTGVAAPDVRRYIYSNGPKGDVDTPGVFNDVGAFQLGHEPLGRDPQFLFDVILKAESLAAFDDATSVAENGSVSFDVLGNDLLISGEQAISISGPGENGPAGQGTEFLVYGDTGFSGSGGSSASLVPEDRIQFVHDSINIVNDGSLGIVSFDHNGAKGQVRHLGDGVFEYTPSVPGPDTDTFTYGLTDGKGNTKEATVTVTISEINDLPTVVLENTTTALAENADMTQRLKVADIVVTDDERGTNALSLSGDDAEVFEIDGDMLYIKAEAVLDHETNPVLDVTVAVDDATVGATPDDTAALAVDVTDTNEFDPVVEDQVFAAIETSPNGTTVGTVAASDADTSQTLSFAITAGNEAGAFRIVADTGEITVADTTQLDHKVTPQHTLSVVVTDSVAPVRTDTATVTIAVWAAEPDRHEPNETYETAAELGDVGGQFRIGDLTLHVPGNVDWYRFDTLAMANRESAVSVTFDHALGDLDLHVYRWQPGGPVVLQPVGSSAGVWNEESVSLHGQPEGTYFAKVVGFENATNPHYSLRIDAVQTHIEADRFEPNNTIPGATGFGAVQGQAVHSELTIHDTADQDLFRFETLDRGVEGHGVWIDFHQAAGDLDLELLDENGAVLATSEGVLDRESISLAGRDAGTYYVRVYGFGDTTSPEYTLTIDVPEVTIQPDDLEPNDTSSTSTDLGVVQGAVVFEDLTIHDEVDEDRFRFELAADGRDGNVVQIDFRHAVGDLEVELRDANGMLLAVSAGVQNRERISLADLTAGVYFARVFGGQGATSPDYTLTIDAPSLVIGPDYLEPNDTRSTSTDLRVVQGVMTFEELTIHDVVDEDLFRFEMAADGRAGNVVQIDFRHALGDLDLVLFDSNMQQLSDSRGVLNRERVSLAGLPAGTYFAQADGFEGAVSPDYTLTIDAPQLEIDPDYLEPNDTRSTSTDLRVIQGAVVFEDLTIHNAVDEDLFRFEQAIQGRTGNVVQIDFRHAYGDLDLELLDENMNVVVGSYGVQDRERVSLAGLPAGAYFARVYGFEGETNPGYTLMFDAPELEIAPDYFESNDTSETAVDFGEVQGNLALAGLTIHEPGNDDWFRFRTVDNATRLHFVSVDFVGDEEDLDLELYDAHGNLLDTSAGFSDREEIGLRGRFAGEYFVRVFGYDGAVSSDYTLTLQTPEWTDPVDGTLPPDRYEPNDSQAGAYDLKAVEGTKEIAGLSVHASGNEDWFRFQTAGIGSGGHFVAMDFQHELGDLDIALYGPSGAIASSTSIAGHEEIGLDGLPGGEYFLRVYGYEGAVNPEYALTIDSPVATPLLPDHMEPNDTPETATLLRTDASGERLTGSHTFHDLTIHAAGDVDYFRFTTEAVGSMAHGATILAPHENGDLGIELLNDELQRVAQSNGQEDAEHISFDGLIAGTYYLRVFGADGATNQYDLSIDAPVSEDPAQNLDDWTVLVYVTASDLASFAFDDVNEMEVAASRLPGSVNLAVLWDQSSSLPTYATGGGTQAAWGTTGRAILASDTNPFSVATRFEILEELNTGSPATLREFIEWSTTVAPARNYALVMWDHGSGLSGFNFDNADLGQAVDYLTTSELVTALDEASVPNMRLVSFDACLMAMAEVGYSLRELTDVFVASQEVVSGTGHDYTTLFETLYENGAAVDPDELATGFVRSFEGQYGGTGATADTQSAVRTVGYDALASALGAFVAAAESATTAELDAMGAARNAAVGYAFNHLRDLGSFMASIENDAGISNGIRDAASGVLDSIEVMGVAKSSDSRNSSGVSIFLPADGRQVDSYADRYVSFDAVSGWSSFLHALGDSAVTGSVTGGVRALLAPDWSERNDVPALAFDLRHVRGDGNTYTGLNLQHNSDVDWFRFTIDAAGGGDDRVIATPASGQELTLQLYDHTGTTVLAESTGADEQSSSLNGLAAGDYLIRVAAGSAVPFYSLLIDAPDAPSSRDWAGGNSTPDKAYPLGVIDNHVLFSGLNVTNGADDWFTIVTPRMAEASRFVLTISVGQGKSLSAELRDAGGDVVSSASGSGQIQLPYTATGAGETYTLHITSTPIRTADRIDFNLLFQVLYAHWHNAVQPHDVTGNAHVEALDVLTLINQINSHPGDASLPAPSMEASHFYYDVNADDKCTAYDVLQVIKYINRNTGQADGGEGENVHVEALASAELNLVVPASWARIPERPNRSATNLPFAMIDQNTGAAVRVAPVPIVSAEIGPDVTGRDVRLSANASRNVWLAESFDPSDRFVSELDAVLSDIARDIDSVFRQF